MFENSIVKIVYNVMMIFSSCCSLLWMAIIFKASPIEMKDFKWVLFKLALMEELFVVFLGVVVRPDPLFPAQCAAILGLVAYLDQFAARLSLAMTFFFAMSVFISINDCVHFRSLIIHQKHALIAKLMKPYIGIPLVLFLKSSMALPLFITMFMAFEEPEKLIPRMKELGYYKYISFYAEQGTSFLSMDLNNVWTLIAAGTILLGLLLFYFLNLISALLLLRELRRLQSHMAEKTYRANLAIFYMLFAQNFYPVVVLFLPTALTVYGFFYEMRLFTSEIYKHLSISGILMFPSMSCLTSICFMTPYREYVKGIFFKNQSAKGNKKNTTTNIVTTVSWVNKT